MSMFTENRRNPLFKPECLLSSLFGCRGFTLIELLIVTAMVLILFSVAAPSFLEAQVRDQVVRAKADIRTIAFAMEEYYRDYKVYPAESQDDAARRSRTGQGLFWLTSPIAYLAKAPTDPFCVNSHDIYIRYYETGGIKNGKEKCLSCLITWALFSRGPDLMENQIVSNHPHWGMYDGCVDSYSPTNGTRSLGDIFQYGGDPQWIGVIASMASGSPTKYPTSPLVVDGVPYLYRMPPKMR